MGRSGTGSRRGGRRHAVGPQAAVADPGRRSRAWGILAVSLALMALVTALSSTTSRRTLVPAASRVLPRGAATAGGRRTHPSRTKDTTAAAPHANGARGAGGSTSGTVFLTGALASAITSTQPQGSSGTATGVGTAAGVGGATGGGAIGSSRTPQIAEVAPAGGVSTPATSSPAVPSPGQEVLDAAAPTATFFAAGGGIVSADATWTGTSSLELSITCPGGVSVSRTGQPWLSLEADDSQGGNAPCAVSLSLPPGVRADVSFTLTIQPAP